MPIYKMQGKKDGKQKYRVRINYQDNAGTPRQIDRVVYGSEDAKMLEMQLLQNLKEELPSKSLTVKQLHEEYLLAKKKENRETTLDKHRRIVELHVLTHIGDMKISKLNVQNLQAWKLTIEALDLGLVSRKHIFNAFRAILNYAVKLEYIPKNPLVQLGNFKGTEEVTKEMDYYTADEFKTFISAAKDASEDAARNGNFAEWHYYVFFAIAFYTGLRKGEIHALRWCDVDDSYLSVKRSLAQKLKGGDRITPPKNKSSIRTLQIPDPLDAILTAHKERCKHVAGFSDDLLVCGGISPLRDSTLNARNTAYSSAAGIKRIRIHDFRHSHASLLANEGINIQEIARRLGHSKIEETWKTYSHLYPREEERAINILNKIV